MIIIINAACDSFSISPFLLDISAVHVCRTHRPGGQKMCTFSQIAQNSFKFNCEFNISSYCVYSSALFLRLSFSGLLHSHTHAVALDSRISCFFVAAVIVWSALLPRVQLYKSFPYLPFVWSEHRALLGIACTIL